jgi:hypothetical protein
MWLEYRASHVTKKTSWRALAALVGTTAAVYLPFFIWNPSALYSDLVQFVGGSIPHTYVIGGDSLWQWLVILHLVDSPYTLTPHAFFVGLAALGGLWLGCAWLRARRTASQWLMSVALVTLMMSIVNRFFFENYAAAIFLLFVTALVYRERERAADIVVPA